MNPPRLSRALVLEAPVREPDGAGGFRTGWRELGRHWAEVVPQSAGRQAEEGLAPVRPRHRITLRAAAPGSPARPRAGQRLREGGRVFVIRAVSERDPEGRFLVCFTEEAVA